MRSLSRVLSVGSALVASASCSIDASTTCRVHCWEHRPVVEDADDGDLFD